MKEEKIETPHIAIIDNLIKNKNDQDTIMINEKMFVNFIKELYKMGKISKGKIQKILKKEYKLEYKNTYITTNKLNRQGESK